MSEDEDLQDQVEEITTTSFQIGGCPIKTFKRFIKYCEENSTVNKVMFRETIAPNGAKVTRREIKREVNYSIGLDRLLDCAESDAKTVMLYNEIEQLKLRIDAVEVAGAQPIVEKKKPTTFGEANDKPKGLQAFGAPTQKTEQHEVEEDVKTI